MFLIALSVFDRYITSRKEYLIMFNYYVEYKYIYSIVPLTYCCFLLFFVAAAAETVPD